jgi:hypothetical protein
MDSSRNWTNWIGLYCAIDSIIIFPSRTSKSVKGPFPTEYDQRVIIKFLRNEKVNISEIKHRLQGQFHEEVCLLRIVQFWIGKRRRGHQDLYDGLRPRRFLLDNFDIKSLVKWNKSPFESIQSIAETLFIGCTIVLLYLRQEFCLKSFRSYLIPYVLTDKLCKKWKEYIKVILPFLYVAQRDGWHHFVTGNQLYFLEYIITSYVDSRER